MFFNTRQIHKFSQKWVLIGADEASIRAFLIHERICASETERHSLDRLLTSFEVALAGDPKATCGVAQALLDSFNDVKSLFNKSIHQMLQEFRAVSAFYLKC